MSMQQKYSVRLVGAVALLGLCSFAAVGCLGFDPNKNTMTITGSAGGGGGGSGGSGGGGGPPPMNIVGSPLETFDANVDSFSFSTYNGDAPMNLEANFMPGNPPTIMWDSADGSPASPGGSLQVFAPYSGANQYVDIQSKSYPSTGLQNFTGGKLHVRVKVDSGSTFTGQIEPYVDTSPPSYFFVGTSINVMPGNDWHDYVVDLGTAMTRITGYDLSKVVLYGVHIGSGSSGGNATPVTFHIDSFSIEGVSLGTDAGGAGGDAGTTSDGGAGN